MDTSDSTSSKIGGLFHSSRYILYQDRLTTYKKWPKQMHQDMYTLAAAGLFYTQVGDICECFSCGVRLSQWELFESALAEHNKWSKDCLFLKMVGYGDRQTDDCQRPIETLVTTPSKHCTQIRDFCW